MTRPRVLVCGDVINDILVETSAPLIDGQDNPAAITARPGGSAANQAAWMAALGLDVVFAGRAGAQDAEFHSQELARFGVAPRLAADESASTGSIVVLVGPDGERTMITDRGANLRLRPADVPPALLDGAALLHLTGLLVLRPRAARGRARPDRRGGAAGRAVHDRSRLRGVPRDAGARRVPGLDSWRRRLLPEPGRGGDARRRGRRRRADPAAMAAFLTRYYHAAVIKLGADGALVAGEGAQPARVAARSAVVRDTTGAGDAFCAGFLAAWLAGSRMTAAARAGGEAAAVAVSGLGGRPA